MTCRSYLNWNVHQLLSVPGVHNHQLLTDVRFTEYYVDSCGMRCCAERLSYPVSSVPEHCWFSFVSVFIQNVNRLRHTCDDKQVQSAVRLNRKAAVLRGVTLLPVRHWAGLGTTQPIPVIRETHSHPQISQNEMTYAMPETDSQSLN